MKRKYMLYLSKVLLIISLSALSNNFTFGQGETIDYDLTLSNTKTDTILSMPKVTFKVSDDSFCSEPIISGCCNNDDSFSTYVYRWEKIVSDADSSITEKPSASRNSKYHVGITEKDCKSISPIYSWLHGQVIDMFFFDMWEGTIPNWIPFWGGHYYSLQSIFSTWFHRRVTDMFFFDIWEGIIPNWILLLGGHYYSLWPIFNIADASIFIGVTIILLFQKEILS